MKKIIIPIILVIALVSIVFGTMSLQAAPKLSTVVMVPLSGKIVDFAPAAQPVIFETQSYEQVRHISISILINFSSSSGQWVQILSRQPSGGDFVVKWFFNAEGSQQFETYDFNAKNWYIKVFNNNSVNTTNVNVDYLATITYSP